MIRLPILTRNLFFFSFYSGLPIKWTNLDPLGFVKAYRLKYPTLSDAESIEELMNKVGPSVKSIVKALYYNK